MQYNVTFVCTYQQLYCEWEIHFIFYHSKFDVKVSAGIVLKFYYFSF
jgi:hypothetical protein